MKFISVDLSSISHLLSVLLWFSRRLTVWSPLIKLSLMRPLCCIKTKTGTPGQMNILDLDIWLTVHHSITLVDFQLDAQNSCLFTYNTFIKILYMFRALPCSSSGGLRRNCIYAPSGIVTVCRWLSCAPVNRLTFFTFWYFTLPLTQLCQKE